MKMLVRCIKNNLNEIDDKNAHNIIRMKISNNDCKDYEFGITKGKMYNVYGVSNYNGLMAYYIVDDYGLCEPRLFYSCFFEVLENTIPTDWKINYIDGFNYSMLPSSWAENKNFFENLVHFGYTEEKFVFEDIVLKYKQYEVFQDKELKAFAEMLDGDWLMCPSCFESWEQKTEQGVLNCPKCDLLMNSPFGRVLDK